MFKSQGLRVSEQVPFGSLKLGIGIPNIMPEGVLKKGLHKGESSCEAFVKYNIPELYICQVSHRNSMLCETLHLYMQHSIWRQLPTYRVTIHETRPYGVPWIAWKFRLRHSLMRIYSARNGATSGVDVFAEKIHGKWKQGTFCISITHESGILPRKMKLGHVKREIYSTPGRVTSSVGPICIDHKGV